MNSTLPRAVPLDEKDITTKMKSLNNLSPGQLGTLYWDVLGLGCLGGHDYLNPIVDASIRKMALKNHYELLESKPLKEGFQYEVKAEHYQVNIVHDGYGFLTYELIDQRMLPDENSLIYDIRTRDPKDALISKIGTYSPPSHTMENLCAWLSYPTNVLKEASNLSSQPYRNEDELNLAIDMILQETYLQKGRRRLAQKLTRAREDILERANGLFSRI